MDFCIEGTTVLLTEHIALTTSNRWSERSILGSVRLLLVKVRIYLEAMVVKKELTC